MKGAVISEVVSGSIAEEAGIEPGDALLEINGCNIKDIFDYRFLSSDEELELKVRKKSGELEIIEVTNENFEDLGLVFENPLIDCPRSCKNNCIFCFVDQLPRGMRKSLYFKDDDARLSFFQGSYVTLTNMTDEDISRIIKMRISPINISVHTTNAELRVRMLRNPRAGKIQDIMRRFAENRIYMNCQIVLCRGYNDGEELDRTIGDLLKLSPYVKSLAVVPVGLTKHRERLAKLEPFDRESSARVLKQVATWQEKAKETFGTRFVFPADEFFILAGRNIPPYEYYEDFPQMENGVGLIANMEHEFKESLKKLPESIRGREVSVITGVAAANFINSIAKILQSVYNNLKINVYPVKNLFFGESVTVAGLVCGRDIIGQLKDEPLGDFALIPSVMLRYGTDVFLDDVTVSDLERKLGCRVKVAECSGNGFIEGVILD